MAKLIKLKNAPQKWLLKEKLSIFSINKPVSLSFIADAKKKSKECLESTKKAKKEIEKFVLEKDTYYSFCFEKSTRTYQSHLVSETILFAINWAQDIKKEADAIHGIAQMIAENILGEPSLQGFKQPHEDIENRLINMVQVFMWLPIENVDAINTQYPYVPIMLHNPQFYRFLKDSAKARLEVQILGKSLLIEFDPKDVDKILTMVHSALVRSTIASVLPETDNEKIV